VRSNEPALDLWFPYIDGIGGGYFGIGADQNYTMLARARSELAWLMDYDIVVVQVHRIYRAFVLASGSPAEFVARWDDGAKEDSLALIDSALAGDPELEALKRVYKSTQPQLTEYFDSCLTRRRSRYPTGWLSDPALYRYVKDMMAAGRIRFLRGDLLGPTTVLGIADAARKLGVPIRVVYLSNAEEWFPFNAQYRANLGALPGDEPSVALRTTQRFHLPIADGKWNYQVESLAHLQRALADPAAPILGDIVYAAIPDADDGTSRLGVDVME
jgi:hypothetical protein